MNRSTPESPPRIPDYEMLRRIGGGSYGSVWLARTATGVYRAVKVVWRDRFEDAAPYEREFRGLREFERVSLAESRQLALLHVGRRDEEGFFYYVMELADDVEKGREIDPETYRPFTLRELPKSASMTVERVVQLGIDMARGLAFLHHRNLVHRDIKPSNVILVNGVPKLADIGLVASSTMALTFVGTEGFVAPEGPGKPPADVYALGKVLYELATGMDRQRFPELPEGFADRTDRLAFLELNAVILRSCDPDLKSRYADAGVLLEDLLMIQAGKSVRRLRAAERGLQRALRWVALLAAVASVAGAGAWVAWSRAQQEMALRAEAEAERDALARRTQYAGLLVQAARSVEREEMGLARLMSQSAADALTGEPVGPEWHWIHNASLGRADVILKERGMGVRRMVSSPTRKLLAVVQGDLVATLYNLETNQEVLQIPGVLDLAGWDDGARMLIGTDERGLPARWVADGSDKMTKSEWPAAEAVNTPVVPLGVWGSEGLWAVEPRGAGRMLLLSASDEPPRWLPLGPGMESEAVWRYFRHAVSADGQWVAVAWVENQGDAARFYLSVTRQDGRDMHGLVPKVRPGSLGWTRTSGDGDWNLEVVDDASWNRSSYDPDNRSWRDLADDLSQDRTRARFEVDGMLLGVENAVLKTSSSEGGHHRFVGHGGDITQVVPVSGHADILSGSGAGEVFRWRSARLEPRRRLAVTAIGETGLRFLFSRDGEWVFVPDCEGVRVVSIDEGREVSRWRDVRWVYARVEGGILGVNTVGNRVVLVTDEGSGTMVPLSDEAPAKVRNLAATPDLSALVYTRSDGSLWHRREGGADGLIPVPPDYRWGLQIDVDGRNLWFTDAANRVVALSLIDMREIWSREMPARVGHLAWLPKRRQVVAAATNGELWVFDADSGEVQSVVLSGTPSADVVLVTEDLRRAFVGGHNGAVSVFDTRDWMHLVTLGLPEKSSIWMLAISQDGTRLAGLTREGHLHLLAESRALMSP